MDKNEVITLSSDEETETIDRTEKFSISAPIKPGCNNISKLQKNPGVIIKNNKEENKSSKDDKQFEKTSKDSPEVVDLEEFVDKLDGNSSFESYKNVDPDIINLDEPSHKNDSSRGENTNTHEKNQSSNKIDINTVNSDFSGVADSNNAQPTNVDLNQNLKFFTEFVEYCGSLEKIPNDRIRLTKKLMKRYGEADSDYIKSQEFRYLIEKCRAKISKNNLYLIAKEITEELSFKKKVAINATKPREISQNDAQKADERTENTSFTFNKKRARLINKIVKKLDKLGNKIRELEEKEVDLSDEEDSTYVLLQRCRDRFCQIYKRLCAYTNQIPDPNNRKICFTESKYPAINKCIENWLNKTKRFPDFSDIMKLLESQSSSLGLPSNKEVVRTIAVEIFQKVGVMLQRRRIYDLWDIFCGFLDDGKDPADGDPDLDKTLKSNFETRLQKEQEIFQYYAELQEKEKLEPEEVADEEANHSPVESENEDDKEIEEIENNLNKRVDDVIKNEEDIGSALKNESSESRDNSMKEPNLKSPESENSTAVASKETKNNYRNCKSLKWRQENSGKSKTDTSVSEDSSTGTENEKEKSENGANNSEQKKIESDDVKNGDSDLELIPVEETKAETGVTCTTVCKRVSSMKIESSTPKKKKYSNTADFDVFDIDDENGKTNEVFGVHCCQIFPDNVFQDFREEKNDWEKRKVFRDLTNINRLMELHGKRKKISGLFSPSFFHGSFCEFEKSSWKKRFKVSFRLVGNKEHKCALNQEEKSAKTNNSDSGGDSDEKDIHSNSEGGGDDEGNHFFNGHGNGDEEDDNEDDNKKTEGNSDDVDDVDNEEDEEEESESEKVDIMQPEHAKQFLFNQKTEEEVCCKNNKTTLEINTGCKQTETDEKMEVTLESQEESTEERQYDGIQNQNEEATSRLSATVKTREGESEETMPKNSEAEETITEGTYSKVKNNEQSEEFLPNTEILEVVIEEGSELVIEKTENNNLIVAKPKSEEVKVKNESLTPEGLKNHLENLRLKAGLKLRNKKPVTVTPEKLEVEPTIWESVQLDLPIKQPHRNTPSPSDEERVKRFLMHSPSSISITPPKKLTLSKPPSQSALQALATLRNLKDISATIVRNKRRRTEDDVEDPAKRHSGEENSNAVKRGRTNLPVISSVQSMAANPKIVTVQGNFAGFDEHVPRDENSESSSIRISSVWGNLPCAYTTIPKVGLVSPGCSSGQSNPSEKQRRKKNSKKTVEYVVLE